MSNESVSKKKKKKTNSEFRRFACKAYAGSFS